MTEEILEKPKSMAVPRSEKRFKKTVKKRVVIEEQIDDAPDEKLYEPVTFRFWNEEQKGVPVFYEWIDKWTKINECKGYMYDGGTYTLPRIAYEYYRDQCQEPIYSNVSEEIVPGQPSKVSRVTGRKPRFRMDVIHK